MHTENDDILTLEETAVYLKCSNWLIMDLCKKHKLPYFRVGNMYRFRKSVLDNWINKEEKKNCPY